MPNTISQKLRIQKGFSLLTVNAPADFKKGLEGLPSGVKFQTIQKIITRSIGLCKTKLN